jgi:glycosyltransferase involved in cell wall biosynthesis
MKILIFIPAKNEAATISLVINTTRQIIDVTNGIRPDVLVIDDGSVDQTTNLAKQQDALTVRHQASRGLGNIFQEAVEFATNKNYDIMLTIDGDNQFDSQQAADIIKPIIDNEADFVTGCRFANGYDINNMPITKRIGNRIITQIINRILEENYRDVSCGFRAYSKEALLNLNLAGGFTYTQEVFLNLGYKKIRIKEVPIKVTYFQERKSRIANNIIRYAYQTSKIIIKSLLQYRPLKIFGASSFIFIIISLPVFLAILVRFLITGNITPYKALSIISALGLVLGFSLIIIGVLLNIISRIKLDVDKVLYYQKKNR